MPQLQDELFELENKLLDPDLRRNPDKLASLFADDFLELGSSGHAYDKKRILFLLKRQMPPRLYIEEFRIIQITDSAALVTYRAGTQSTRVAAAHYYLRSSFWF